MSATVCPRYKPTRRDAMQRCITDAVPLEHSYKMYRKVGVTMEVGDGVAKHTEEMVHGRVVADGARIAMPQNQAPVKIRRLNAYAIYPVLQAIVRR